MTPETLLDRSSFFWRGRVALYAILEAYGIGDGDEVILPGFTCVVVPNAILYRGARPIYVDIDPHTFLTPAAYIETAITDRTRAIIIQNTFGLAPQVDEVIALARRRGIRVIEDCAHGFGGHADGILNGTTADAAFFSTQWSKPLSTGIGGFAYCRDPALRKAIAAVAKRCCAPSLREEAMLAAQLLAHATLLRPRLYWRAVDTYRFLTQRTGLALGSSSQVELLGTQRPSDYLKTMGHIQRRVLKQRLHTLPKVLARRRATAAAYDQILPDLGFTAAARPGGDRHAFLRYPVLVNDRAATLAQARAHRVPIGDWFHSPLHPIREELDRWGYKTGSCPQAESVCQRIINLPTESTLSADTLRAVLI